MRNKGFTLLELLIVVIVIAVLATIALPQFTNVAEQGRASKARANLNTMAGAERTNEATTGSYLAAATEAAILTNFGVDAAADTDWDYSVTVTNPTTGTPTFTLTASRSGGRNSAETLILDNTGDWAGTWTP